MTQESNLPLAPPPRKVHVRPAIRNLRRAYVTAFTLMITVFGGWALLDAMRWSQLTYSEGVLSVSFALLAALAFVVLQFVNHPLRRELRLGKRGEVAQGQIVSIGQARRRRAMQMIVYTFRTTAGDTVESQCILPRRFPAQTLEPGMAIDVLYDPRSPRINKPRLALEYIEFGEAAKKPGERGA